MPRGIYQYKFIVDNIWCFSKQHPTCNDGKGNINNIIDTTNVDIDAFLKMNNEKKPITQNRKADSNDSNGQKFKKSDSYYNNTFPCKSDLNVDAGVVPDNYKELYNINNYHKQYLIGNKDYLRKKNIKDYIGGNTSFISIPVAPHVNL